MLVESTAWTDLRRLGHAANERILEGKDHRVTLKDFESLYSYTTGALEDEVSKLHVRAPPPELFTVIIRQLLYPDIILQDIPDLLEALSDVEHHRHHVAERARMALTHAEYWERTKTVTHGLTEDDKRVLKKLCENTPNLRESYLKAVSQFCLLHLRYVWISAVAQSSDATLLTDTLWRYFPMIMPGDDKPPPYEFELDFSEEEKSAFKKLGEQWIRFMKVSWDWAKEHRAEGQELADVLRSESFNDAFPVVDQAQLRGMTEAYLRAVEQQVDQLEAMLDTAQYERRTGKGKGTA